MKILHTGDWHLGKKLEGISRIEEQRQFLKDFVTYAAQEKADLILIAGDVYDKSNPSAEAEILFYQTVEKLTRNGECIVLMIAGNHDSPDRLSAAQPLAQTHGVIIVGKPKTIVPIGTYGKHTVINSGEGYIELQINDEKAIIVTVPYLSEKRLNEIIYQDTEDDIERAITYNDRLKQLFESLGTHYREDTINLVMAHLFALSSEESGSEQAIQLGGTYSFNASYFPKEAQYIALGHVHKPQIVPKTQHIARYAGSPLQYNKREAAYQKSFLDIEIEPKQEPIIKQVPISVYKPIEIWQCNSIEEAIEKCERNKDDDSYVYIEIKTDRYIREDELKQMKSLKADIIEVLPKFITAEIEEKIEHSAEIERDIVSWFKEFYKKEKKVDVDTEILEAFIKLVKEREETSDEADFIESERTQ